MQNTQIQAVQSSMCRIAEVLDDLAADCEPEFDATYDDLEREFAELRMQLGEQ